MERKLLMRLEYRTVPCELKMVPEADFGVDGGTLQGGPWQFEGLAATFHNIDDSLLGDIIAPGAFTQDMAAFLESGFIGGLNHDWGAPIGRPLEASEVPAGLAVKASISDTASGRDVRTLMKDGVIRRLSIGFRALGRTWLETADEVHAYWRRHGYTPTPDDLSKVQRGARLLTRIRLYEISPVAVPANPRAVIAAVKGAPKGCTFEQHSELVLATCEEFLARTRALAELRRSEGRALSAERLAVLRRLRAGIDELLSLPMLATHEAAQLYTRYQAIEARLLGVGA
jgi:HK97 family phage prohead protease